MELTALKNACANLWEVLIKRQRTAKQLIWTTEIQRLRALAFHAAWTTLFACDVRVAALGVHPIVAQLMLPLFEMLPSPYHSIYALATADEIAFDAMWCRMSYPTFNLTHSLASNLLLSDPAKIDEGDVPWPFSTFRVVMPLDTNVQFVDSDKQPTRVQCFRVTRMTVHEPPAHELSDDAQGVSLAALYAVPNMARYREELKRMLDAHFAFVAGFPTSERVMIRAYGASSVSIFHNSVWEGSGTFCGDWLALDVGDSASPMFGPQLSLEDADTRALLILRRLALNLALYMRSKRPDNGAMVWTPAAKASSSMMKTWTLGGHVKVSAEVHDAAKSIIQGRPHGPVRVQHIVRGHFKTVGHDDRSIYVAPYWRGPANGPTTDRVYDVK